MVECHRGESILTAKNDGSSGIVSNILIIVPGADSLIKIVARSGRLSERISLIPMTNGRKNF